MREVKFRAWDKKRSVMYDPSDLEELYMGAYFSKCNTTCLSETDYRKLIIMQYTGLNDKNDEEIYEGDILEDENRTLYEVIFNPYYGFIGVHKYTDFKSWTIIDDKEEYSKIEEVIILADLYFQTKIIGNIYDNSEYRIL